MKKGIAVVILVALVAAVSAIIIEGIYFNVFVGTTVSSEEAAKEIEVLKAVNKVEAVKRGLPQVLYYSFSQGAYQLLKTGGYTSTENVQTIDSIPVWKNGDQNFYPYFMGGLTSNVHYIFNQYVQSSKEVKIPAGEISIEFLDDKVSLNFSSSGLLSYESDLVNVHDVANASIEIKTKIGKIFDLGKQVAESNTACSGSTNYVQAGLKVTIESKNNAALVKIEDPENSFPVYDGVQAYKKLVLQFYVVC